jgi:hypothetical protein
MIASRHCQQIVRYQSDSVGCRRQAWLQTSQTLAWQAWSLRQSPQFGDVQNAIGEVVHENSLILVPLLGERLLQLGKKAHLCQFHLVN